MLIITAFTFYFVKDFVTLKKALLHPDIYTYYYSFRYWFSRRLVEGHLPLWNPYWGLGHPAEAWATIPLDLYTPLELLFGPRYHVFQAIQTLGILVAALYALRGLGASPLVSAGGAILFFLSPWVSYFSLYFIHGHSFIANVLLFLFVALWFQTRERKHLLFIFWTTFLSLLGTKPELWFYQTAYFLFLVVAGSVVFGRRGSRDAIQAAGAALGAMTLGLAANAWQFNFLLRVMAESGRVWGNGLGNLWSPELYRNFLLSLSESVLLKVGALAFVLYLALGARLSRALALTAGVVVLAFVFVQWDRVVFVPDEGLKNGGLESWVASPGGGETPLHFSYRGDRTSLKKIVDPLRLREGRAAALLNPSAAGPTNLRYELPRPQDYRGHYVRLAFWMRSDNTTPGSIRAEIEDGVAPAGIRVLPAGSDWTRVVVDQYIEPEATSVVLGFTVLPSATAGLLLDEVSLERSSGLGRSLGTRDGTLLGLSRRFLAGPVAVGAALGLFLSALLTPGLSWRDHAKAGLLFLLFVYYYCREGRGDLGEMEVLSNAPAVFRMSLGAFVWLGCTQVRTSARARLAYGSVLFIFLMRDQGQIVLAYLAGLQWVPTRDSYIVDSAFVVLAVTGLGSLPRPGRPSHLPEALTLLAVGATLVSLHPLPYVVHPLVGKAPPEFPYFEGIPNVRALLHQLRDGPTTRVFFANDAFMEFHHGMGSSLLEGIGQVSQYGSLTSARYRDWAIFHNLKITPEERWRGYSNELTPGTIARLPLANGLGYPNSEIYKYTLVARPPLDGNLLRFLGVSYALRVYPVIGPYTVENREPSGVEEEVRRLKAKRLRAISGRPLGAAPGPMYLADLGAILPRAFVVYGISGQTRQEFQNELSPVVERGAIRTRSVLFPMSPATIVRYAPEQVTVAVEAKEGSVLVLSDLYHPFWRATVDGAPAAIFPALYVFRGVTVPKGSHQVEFTCRVPSMAAASALSVLLVVVGGTASVTAVYKRKRDAARKEGTRKE